MYSVEQIRNSRGIEKRQRWYDAKLETIPT